MIIGEQLLIQLFLVFCRVGTACMLLPGFSSNRFPASFRVLLAAALSMAVLMFFGGFNGREISAAQLPVLAISELVLGLFLGFSGALFVHAVRFAAGFISSLIGLAGIPGQPIEDMEASPPLSSLYSMAFTLLLLNTDLHLASFDALLETYRVFPLGGAPAAGDAQAMLLNVLRDTFLLALQISSPFIIYSFCMNFVLGVIGKITPQLQVYFAFTGVAILGAFLALFLLAPSQLSLAADRYRSLVENGF
jgi:flagellar biosynthesis protein FliR